MRGDLDLAGRDTVAPVLLGAAAAGRPLTVDLTEVGYLSSAGVALLAEAAGLAPTLSIVVAAGSAPARVCALTGLATAVPVQEVAGDRRVGRRRQRNPGVTGPEHTGRSCSSGAECDARTLVCRPNRYAGAFH